MPPRCQLSGSPECAPSAIVFGPVEEVRESTARAAGVVGGAIGASQQRLLSSEAPRRPGRRVGHAAASIFGSQGGDLLPGGLKVWIIGGVGRQREPGEGQPATPARKVTVLRAAPPPAWTRPAWRFGPASRLSANGRARPTSPRPRPGRPGKLFRPDDRDQQQAQALGRGWDGLGQGRKDAGLQVACSRSHLTGGSSFTRAPIPRVQVASPKAGASGAWRARGRQSRSL